MLGKSTRIYYREAGDAVACSLLIVAVCLCLFYFAHPARAAVVATGDVDPATDPTTWTSNTLAYIGKTGSGTLDITGGSDVIGRYGYIGRYTGSTGQVTVDGAGSTWTDNSSLSSSLYVGYEGSGTLDITGGGAVSNGNGWIGYESGSTGEVTVDGPGSAWTNSSDLYVGRDGSGTLNITGGGAVTVRWDTLVSNHSGSSGAIHFDNGTLTTDSLFCASDDLTGTGTINTGGLISDVDLVFDSTHGLQQTFNINDNPGQNITVNLNVDNSRYMGAGHDGVGTMSISDGIVIESTDGHIGYNSGSTGEVTVDGAGSAWTNRARLYVGRYGSGTLNITGGGAVSSDRGYIGSNSSSTGEVTVDGSGSAWTNSSDLWVGNFGSGTLNITGGGAVTVEGDTWVPRYSGSSGAIHFDDGTLTTGGFICASADLTGTGTINTGGLVSDVDLVFDSTHGLNQTFSINNNPGQNITVNLNVDGSRLLGIGHSGVGTMSISDGIVIESTDGYIGYNSGSTGEVTVDGAGSTWTNSSRLLIGGGTLNITGGGAVSNKYGYIGYESGSTGVVTVDGAGSTWTNSNNISVGGRGSGSLNITGGGAVSNRKCSIGNVSGVVTVDGVGSTWTNSDYLRVGSEGSGTLNITGGGAVSNFEGYIGHYSGSTGEVTVDGVGSTWTNNYDLSVGDEGSGTLNIAGGGVVSNTGYGYIGDESGSTGAVTVDGVGSTWTNNVDLFGNKGQLYIGNSGSGTLNITGGGAVSNTYSYISCRSGSTGEVTVDGVGSTWTNSENLYIGFDGGSGTLNITGGGVASSKYGCVGSYSGSTGEATVDGVGSMWTNNRLCVGSVANYSGGDNTARGTLNITGGGTVSNSSTSSIGYKPGSTGEVTVDGAGSTWTSGRDLSVGNKGSGTLNIIRGGLVSVGGALAIDEDGDEDSFINMAGGGMLALYGDADDSLVDFLGLVDGTDAIRYWDDSILDWADITGATYGRDYMLDYLTEGDLAGYTMLTVDNLLTDVSIDIKPGGDANSINLDSKGNIPVAIFSTDAFDATTVDPATIVLADAGVKARGKKGDLMSSFKDVDLDGLLDLLVHIDTQGLVLGDDDVEAQLTGETFDGLSIFGTDAIRLVGKSGGQPIEAFSSVPEPGTIVLLSMGVLGLLLFFRRR